nr:MAG TPA: hypothetical protein [Caudoviricetes sp.]DAX96186.1 MAG TPA: hypothetical protein [Bacteriophage sp.]
MIEWVKYYNKTSINKRSPNLRVHHLRCTVR